MKIKKSKYALPKKGSNILEYSRTLSLEEKIPEDYLYSLISS